MLVLRREPGQRILIGKDCWIEIIQCKSGHVRLGITAPKSTLVLRGELADNRQEPKDGKLWTR